jgi:hypothetical protein
MRICLISTARNALDDRLYYKEARSLAKEHEITLVARPPYNGTEWRDDQVVFVPIDSTAGKLSRLIAVLRVPFWLRKRHFDVVHVVDYDMMPLLPLIRWWLGTKVVYDVWEAN